jgi:hypothetical protein
MVAALLRPVWAQSPDEPRKSQPAAPTAASTDEEIIPNPPKSRAIIIGGVAAGFLLLGGILGGVAKSRADEQTGNAANPQLYTPDLQSRAGEGNTLATTGYIFLAVGGALAIVDAVLWVETLRKPRTVPRSKMANIFTPAGVRF